MCGGCTAGRKEAAADSAPCPVSAAAMAAGWLRCQQHHASHAASSSKLSCHKQSPSRSRVSDAQLAEALGAVCARGAILLPRPPIGVDRHCAAGLPHAWQQLGVILWVQIKGVPRSTQHIHRCGDEVGADQQAGVRRVCLLHDAAAAAGTFHKISISQNKTPPLRRRAGHEVGNPPPSDVVIPTDGACPAQQKLPHLSLLFP